MLLSDEKVDISDEYTTDVWQKITAINLNIGNKSSVFASCSEIDLYQMSKDCGYQYEYTAKDHRGLIVGIDCG